MNELPVLDFDIILLPFSNDLAIHPLPGSRVRIPITFSHNSNYVNTGNLLQKLMQKSKEMCFTVTGIKEMVASLTFPRRAGLLVTLN